MSKKSTGSSRWYYLVPIFGFIMMVGLSMAIFEIPYGMKVAEFGLLWFVASLIVSHIMIEYDRSAKKKVTQGC